MAPQRLSSLAFALRLAALLALGVPVIHALGGCDSTEEAACGNRETSPLEVCLPGDTSAGGSGAAGGPGALVCASPGDAQDILNKTATGGDEYRLSGEAQVKDTLCCYPARRLALCD